jgi:hypothetical protein
MDKQQAIAQIVASQQQNGQQRYIEAKKIYSSKNHQNYQ